MKKNFPKTLYKLTFHRLDSGLRWVHFVSSPWVSENGALIEAYVVFSHATRRINNLELTSIDGTEIRATVNPVDELPEELEKFNELPAGFKNFLRVSFEVAEPEIVVGKIVEGGHDKSLFTLVPKIAYPEFLFDITQHAESAFENISFENFVETGTLFGHTAVHASRMFERVFTIELDKELHSNACRMSNQFPNIEFIHGDSGLEIKRLVGSLRGATVFFLDAHWSGDSSVDWKSSRFSGFPSDTAHLGTKDQSNPTSAEQVPLDKELTAIIDDFPDHAILIIDDWQSIGRKDYAFVGEDWTHLSHDFLLDQFASCPRVIFHYPYDEKHYVVGLDVIRQSQ